MRNAKRMMGSPGTGYELRRKALTGLVLLVEKEGMAAAKAVLEVEMMDVHIIRIMEGKNISRDTREIAFYLIEKLFAQAPGSVPASLVQSLSSIAASSPEPYRIRALKILISLAITNTEITASCFAFPTLANSVLDENCKALRETIVLTLMQVADNATGRGHLDICASIRYMVAPLLQHNMVTDKEKRSSLRHAAAEVVVVMMRTYAGIFLLGSSALNALEALICMLTHPIDVELQLVILDLLSKIFDSCSIITDKDEHGKNILSVYSGMVLLALLNAGIVPGLSTISLQSENPGVHNMSKTLLSRFFSFARRHLPKRLNDELLSLPELMSAAAQRDYSNRKTRLRGMRAVEILQSLEQSAGVGVYRSQVNETNQLYANDKFFRLSRIVRYSNRSVDPVMKMVGDSQRLIFYGGAGSVSPGGHKGVAYFIRQQKNMNAPFGSVQADIKKSGVTASKEVFEWHWPTIATLFDGALQNQNHLLETMRSHDRFVRRVAGFYRGTCDDKAYFSQLSWKLDHMSYVGILCQMMGLLMESYAGNDFIQHDRRGRLIHNIVEELKAIGTGHPANGVPAGKKNRSPRSSLSMEKNFLFSRKKIGHTMAREYFTLLGYMSSTLQGEAALQNAGLIKEAVKLSNDPSKDYISRLLVVNLDISRKGSPAQFYIEQILLNDGPSLELKLYALRTVGWSLSCSVTATSVSWGLSLFCQQICKSTELSRAALELLGSVLESKRDYVPFCIENLRDLNITDELKPLLVNSRLFGLMVGSVKGLSFVQKMAWLEPAINAWLKPDGLHSDSVRQIESNIAQNLFGRNVNTSSDNQKVVKPISLSSPWSEHDGDRRRENGALDWFLRLPWVVDVKFSDELGEQSLKTDLKISTNSETDKVDVPINLQHCIVLRGTLLDLDEYHRPVKFTTNSSFSSSLHLGAYTVNTAGKLNQNNSYSDRPLFDPRRSRPRSHSSLSVPPELEELSEVVNQTQEEADLVETVAFDNFSEESSENGTHCRWLFTKSQDDDWYLVAIEYYIDIVPHTPNHVNFPPHLFRDLSRTDEGASLLMEKIDESNILESAFGKKPASNFVQRSSLWMIGYICSTNTGVEILRERIPGLFSKLISLVKNSPSFSIRGTVLNTFLLISASESGAKALSDLGWNKSLPIDYSDFFFSSGIESNTCAPMAQKPEISRVSFDNDDADIKLLLRSLVELTNPVSSKDGMGKLKILRKRNPGMFQTKEVILMVYKVLAQYNLKLNVRRMIHNLFVIR